MKKIILFLTFLFLPSVLFAYTSAFYEVTRSTVGNSTLSDIRTSVRIEIEDSSNTYGTNRYTDAQINSFINTVQQEISIITKCLHTEATGQLTAGTTYYYLPQNCVGIERVLFEDNDDILEEKNPYDMDKTNADWYSAGSSSSTAYYRFPGYEKIGFYPCPEYSDGVIRIWYVKAADLMNDDADEIFDSIPILEYFKRTIVVGASSLIFMIENDARYQTKYQEYTAYINLILKHYDYTPNYNPTISIYKR